VVDDPVGAERAGHVHVPGAAHGGHLRAQRLGELDGERADAARRPVDQDLAVAGLRLVDRPELKHIRGAAPVVDDGLHR
jgi:hypothetical protein